MSTKLWRLPLDKKKYSIPIGEVHIIQNRCKECGFCIEFCPKKVLDRSEDFNEKGYHYPKVVNDECINCGLCESICPEFAIYTTLKSKKELTEEDIQNIVNGNNHN